MVAEHRFPPARVQLFKESRVGVDERSRRFTDWNRITSNLCHAGVLGYKGRRDIPFHWMILAFGLFILACGGTHFMETVTIWMPVYVLSSTVKLFTAAVSITTAAVLPFTVPHAFELVRQARTSEKVTANLRASEERKRGSA